MGTPPNKRFFSTELIKKNLPFILLLILSIFLMFIFRHNKMAISSMIEEGKRNILSLYANNLRPLITKSEVSEEDLFNFALYQSLPLDKQKNKVLFLSNNNGNQVYEIKSAEFNQNTRNYEAFSKLLGLNVEQKAKSDSILASYRKDISSCVLTNDKDAYAVNPKIVKIQQAMLADLITLAHKADAVKARKIFVSVPNVDDQKFASLIQSAKEPATPEYFLITPDTVAKTDLYWDENKFAKQFKQYELGKLAVSDIAHDRAFKWKSDELRHEKYGSRNDRSEFNFKIDSNKYQISVAGSELSKLINDSLRIALEGVSRKLKKLSIRIPKIGHSGSVSITPPIPDLPGIINPAEITQQTFKMLGDLNIPKIIEEAMKQDKEYETMIKDSAKSRKVRDKFREANRKLKKIGMDTLKY